MFEGFFFWGGVGRIGDFDFFFLSFFLWRGGCVFWLFFGSFGGSCFAEWRRGLLSGGVLLLRNCSAMNG